MHLHLNLIAAVCEGMGIGMNGSLPWKLNASLEGDHHDHSAPPEKRWLAYTTNVTVKVLRRFKSYFTHCNPRVSLQRRSEMAFFTSMTSKTKDKDKKNVVLMGRRTWECIPTKYRPLRNRVNMVLTSQLQNVEDNAIFCKSISHAIEIISQPPLKDQIENIWVIGGSSVYKEAMESPYFHRLYLTRIKKYFECDTFFPAIPNNIVLKQNTDVPQGVQEENGIQLVYEVYEKE